MKKVFYFLCLLAGFTACKSGSHDQSSPVSTIDGMFTAMKNGNMEDIKKFIAKSDIAFIEDAEKFASGIAPEAVQKMKTKMGDEFKEKVKDIKYTLKNEKINGDKATVDAEVTENEKTESHTFNLVKEDGDWKISLFQGNNGMFNSMKGNMGPERKDIEAGMEKLKNMDRDSLKALIDKGVKAFEKMDSIAKAKEQ